MPEQEQQQKPTRPQQNFQIGQIVYLLSDKAEAIVPAIVVEELILKKLDGNTVTWKMAVGPPEKKKILASSDLDGEIYTSLEEIREVMTIRLTSFVTNLVAQAEKRTQVWYGKQMVTNPSMSSGGGKIDPASLIDSIDGPSTSLNESQQMPGGDSFKVKAPINQGPLRPSQESAGSSSLRQKLLEMATPDDGEVVDSSESNMVVLPDGRTVPVKVNIQQ